MAQREQIGLRIVDGHVEGWAFIVPRSYLSKLDILAEEIEDREATLALRFRRLRELGFEDLSALKRRVPDPAAQNTILQPIVKLRATRETWTRGVPPAYRFGSGDVLVAADRQHCILLGFGSERKLRVEIHQGMRPKPSDTPDRLLELRAEQLADILRHGLPAVSKMPTVAVWESVNPSPRTGGKARASKPKTKAPVKTKTRGSSGRGLDTVRFDYRDVNGSPSSRRVVVHRVDDKHLEGFCLIRQEERTFRLDRVQGFIVSESTGEMLRPVDAWRIGD